MHGLGDHGGRYDDVGHRWAREGIGVQACDLQGHGRSPGRRGCIASYSQLLAEVAASIDAAQSVWPAARLTLLGHSMGGNLAAMYAIRRPNTSLQRLLLMAPLIRPAGRPIREDWLQAGCSLARYIPNLTWRRRIASSDAHPQLPQDRLMHRRLSLQLGLSLIMSGREILREAPQIRFETRILCGRDDLAIDIAAVEEFAAALSQAQLRWLDRVGHEPLRRAPEEELAALTDWIIGTPSPAVLRHAA